MNTASSSSGNFVQGNGSNRSGVNNQAQTLSNNTGANAFSGNTNPFSQNSQTGNPFSNQANKNEGGGTNAQPVAALGTQQGQTNTNIFGTQSSQKNTFGAQFGQSNASAFGTQQNQTGKFPFGTQPAQGNTNPFAVQQNQTNTPTIGAQPSQTKTSAFGTQPGQGNASVFGTQSNKSTLGTQPAQNNTNPFAAQTSQQKISNLGTQQSNTNTFGTQPGQKNANPLGAQQKQSNLSIFGTQQNQASNTQSGQSGQAQQKVPFFGQFQNPSQQSKTANQSPDSTGPNTTMSKKQNKQDPSNTNVTNLNTSMNFSFNPQTNKTSTQNKEEQSKTGSMLNTVNVFSQSGQNQIQKQGQNQQPQQTNPSTAANSNTTANSEQQLMAQAQTEFNSNNKTIETYLREWCQHFESAYTSLRSLESFICKLSDERHINLWMADKFMELGPRIKTNHKSLSYKLKDIEKKQQTVMVELYKQMQRLEEISPQTKEHKHVLSRRKEEYHFLETQVNNLQEGDESAVEQSANQQLTCIFQSLSAVQRQMQRMKVYCERYFSKFHKH